MSKYASLVTRILQGFLVDQGEEVSVYRPSTLATQIYYAQVQSLSLEDAVKYDPEGIDNLGSSEPHLFAFPKNCIVLVGDEITVCSSKKVYKIVSSITNRIEGAILMLECVGVRQ